MRSLTRYPRDGSVLILLVGFAVDIAGRGVEGHVISFVGATWIAVTILHAARVSSDTGCSADVITASRAIGIVGDHGCR